MTTHPVDLQRRIAEYINEVSKPGIPVFSTSHITLRHLYLDFGKELVDGLLEKHWESERQKKASNVKPNQ